MKRDRDSQRSKVYAAEQSVLGWAKPKDATYDTGRRNLTVEECQEYVDRITHTKWFEKKYGKGYAITVKGGRSSAASWGGRRGHITVGVPSRMEWVLLHEVAHNVTTTQYGHLVAGHAWQFCKNYLDLVHHYLGADAAKALKVAFRERRVRFTMPRERKPLSEAQAAAQAERLAAARAARAAKPKLVWEQTVTDRDGWKGRQGQTRLTWSLIWTTADGDETLVIEDQPGYFGVGSVREEAKRMVAKMAPEYPDSTFRLVIDGSVLVKVRIWKEGYGSYWGWRRQERHEEWAGGWHVPEVVAPAEESEVVLLP